MNQYLKYFLWIAGLFIVGYLFWFFNSLVAYILVAAVFSLIGHPLVEMICKWKIKKVSVPRPIGALVVLMLFWVLVLTVFIIFIPLISREARVLSQVNLHELMLNLKQPIQQLGELLGDNVKAQIENFSFEDYAMTKIMSILSVTHISNFVGVFAGVFSSFIVAFFAISFITFFFLKDDQMFMNILLLIVPEKHAKETKHVILASTRMLKRYFIGLTLEILLVSFGVGIGLYFAGFKWNHLLIIALIDGILIIIPYVGPIIGVGFALILTTVTHLHLNFYTELVPLFGVVLIVFAIVHVLDNVLLQPLIYSNTVNAHPLEIFLIILMAGNIAGVLGMILAIPAYSILRVIAKEFFFQFRIVKTLTKNI